MMKLFIFIVLLFSSCSRVEKQEVAVVPQKKEAKTHLPVVVIDPGHGGKSVGTKTVTKPFFYEKSLALDCGLKVCKYLEDFGYDVRMTRKQDVDVTLQKRVQIAKQGELFVSIHFNNAPNTKAHGVEVYYYDSKKVPIRSAKSKKLAQDILRFVARETNCFSRGVLSGNFHVIRENSIPAVLVEGGFCSNMDEAKKLTDPVYMKKLAYGIARGIDAYSQEVFGK